MGGKGMTQTVNASFARQSGALNGVIKNPLPGAVRQRQFRIAAGREKPVPRTKGSPISLQLDEQFGREQCVTIFAPFALFDANLHARTIDMLGLKIAGLIETQPGPINGHEKGLMLEIGTADR